MPHTRFPTMDTLARKRARYSQENETEDAGKRTRVEGPDLAFAIQKEVVRGFAQWWGPSLEEMRAASSSPLPERAAADTPARTENCCDKSSGKEHPPSDVKEHAVLVEAAKARELATWRT